MVSSPTFVFQIERKFNLEDKGGGTRQIRYGVGMTDLAVIVFIISLIALFLVVAGVVDAWWIREDYRRNDFGMPLISTSIYALVSVAGPLLIGQWQIAVFAIVLQLLTAAAHLYVWVRER